MDLSVAKHLEDLEALADQSLPLDLQVLVVHLLDPLGPGDLVDLVHQ